MNQHLQLFSLPFLAIIFIFLSSCDTKIELEEIKSANGFYSLKIPTFMDSTDKLNNNASLQFQDEYRELYLIVIDEEKSFIGENYTLEEYFKFAEENIIKGNLKDAQSIKPQKKTINGLEALQGSISGKYVVENEGKKEEIAVFYSFAVLKSENKFYQIFLWTMKKQQKQYEPLMQEMINSFKENPNPPKPQKNKTNDKNSTTQ